MTKDELIEKLEALFVSMSNLFVETSIVCEQEAFDYKTDFLRLWDEHTRIIDEYIDAKNRYYKTTSEGN